MSQIVYKIRNKEGLYSRGGIRPYFTEKGKSWTTVGHVKAHLTMVRRREERWGWPSTYLDCVLVELKMCEGSVTPIKDLV